MDTLAKTLARLETLHPRKIDLSLGRMERLLAALDHPERRLPPTIHVAGTNGKGSTIAFMRAILEADGRSVHVYTSPHLVAFNERIRLGAPIHANSPKGGAPVENERLIVALETCEQANKGAPITFFELTTAAAFLLFSQHPADWLLLETGLGGRLDATNVIEAAAVCVLTSISMDHVEFLGSTIKSIAQEKAGILKPNCPAIIGFQSPAAQNALEPFAIESRARLILAGRDFDARLESGRLLYDDHQGLMDLSAPALFGSHQIQNAATAIAALRVAAPQTPWIAYDRGMKTVEWPARFQKISHGALLAYAPKDAEIWIDGGHNDDGAHAIAAALHQLANAAPAPIILICAMLISKDAAAFLKRFKYLDAEIIAIPLSGGHLSHSAQDLAAIAAAEGLASAFTVSLLDALALLRARCWAIPPRILICGSLYLAGEALTQNAQTY